MTTSNRTVLKLLAINACFSGLSILSHKFISVDNYSQIQCVCVCVCGGGGGGMGWGVGGGVLGKPICIFIYTRLVFNHDLL